jgi:hypothetical protein
MKKVFYSITILSAMLFASCSEDRGRTYETADANRDENVNPGHIRGNETAMGTTTDMSGSDAMWRSNSQRIAGQMATDMRLDTTTQNRVQQVLYERERRLSELETNYNYSETNRMGGQVAEDVDNTATTERNRIDRDGGTMTDTRGNMGTNMQGNVTTDATNLQVERERIMEDTDRELQSILTQEQYRQYQERRANYWGMSNDGTNQMQNQQNQNQQNQNQQNNNQMDNSGTNNNLPGTNNSGNNMNRN